MKSRRPFHLLPAALARFAAAAILLALPADAADPATPAPPPAPEPPALTPVLLELLRREQILDPARLGDDKRLAETLLRAAGGGARLISTSTGASPAVSASVPSAILAEHILYFAPATLDGADADLAAAENRLREAQAGLWPQWILDLRATGGGTLADVQALLKKLAASPGDAPLVLIGPETAAGAEWLAALLQRQRGATLIGQPTRGGFTELRRFNLVPGTDCLLPVPLPPARAGLPPGPVRPNLEVDGVPAAGTATGVTAERFAALPDHDPALRKAVDLAQTIHALAPATTAPRR